MLLYCLLCALLSYTHRAISSLLLTSLLFRDAFNSIPDFQNARVSASRISDLLSQQSDISVNDNDGLIIVR